MDNNSIDNTIRKLYAKSPWLHWGRLRFIGSIRVLSVMSFVGAGIAAGFKLPQLSKIDIYKVISEPRIVWSFLVFITSLLIANLIYHLRCPTIIKKFESLSDFYAHQLNIKKSQKETYPDDPFEADLLHVSKQYIKDLSINCFARWMSISLYFVSLIALIFFLIFVYRFTVTVPAQQIYKMTTLFDYNKAEVTTDAKKQLHEIAGRIKQPNSVVIIKGFTCNIGSHDYNHQLSISRATAVRNYLVYVEGLKDVNIDISGDGSFSPAAPNSSEEDRRKNRRVEIEIISCAEK